MPPPSPPDPTNPPGNSPHETETIFNAWLDARFGRQPAASSDHAHSDQPEAIAARSLQALAAKEDAALAHATTAPPWKEILMSSHPIATTTTTTPEIRPATSPRALSRFGGTLNRLVSVAAIIAVLLAGFATAWIARDRFDSNNEASPLLQLAASPTSAFTCTTKTLSQEEVDRIMADYKKQPQSSSTGSDLTITDKPVSAADAEAAIAVWQAFYACPDGEPGTDKLRWVSNVWADPDSSIIEQNLMTDPAAMADGLKQSKAMLEPMSRHLTPLTPADYLVDSNDPAIKPYVITPSVYTGSIAMLPDRFVTFADGRIGAPVFKAYPGGAAEYRDTATLPVLTVYFIIFTKVDGQWLMSQTFSLCPGDCSQAESSLDVYIAYYERLATVIGSPVASPVVSPEATPPATPEASQVASPKP